MNRHNIYPTVLCTPNEHPEREQLLRVMFRHLLANPTVEQLAAYCNQSPSTFKRNFAALLGTTPHRWMTAQKMQIARVMLLDSDAPIKSICHACGFTNESHFIRLFKAHQGLTPSALRHQHRNNQPPKP